MKKYAGIIVLVVIVFYFTFMGNKNINKEKADNEKILDTVVYVEDGKIDPANEGKLVLVSAKYEFDGEISFLEIPDPIKSFKVKRIVEDYVETTNSQGKVSHEWKEREEVDEGTVSFDYLDVITSEEVTLPVMVGEFKLDELGMSKVTNLKRLIDKTLVIGDLEFDGLFYSLLAHEDNEKVGDMRIHYMYYDTSEYDSLSVLAKQVGDSFEPYDLDDKTQIYSVYDGVVNDPKTLEEQLGKEVKTNTKGKFLFILLIVGVGAFLIIDNKKKD